MAAGRKKNNSKNNKNDSRKKVASRIQNALEIAERQMNAPGESDEYVKRSRNAKLNGTIVNPFKKQKNNRDDDDSDDGSKFNYGKDFDIEGSEFEDEEIDSDEAFGSDEDMFDAYDSKFSQTVRDLKLKDKSKRGNQSDSEEDIDPDAYTSIDEDDLMPLSAIWDVNEKVEKEDEDFEKKKKEKLNKNDETQEFQLELNDDVMESESSESESSSDDQNEESDDDIFGKDSDDQEEIDLNTVSKKLQKQVNKGKKPEHRMLSEYNNSLYKEENEFSPFSSKSTNNMNATNNKLDINDLMNVLDADDAKKASLLSVDNTEANKAMAAPLSKSMQEKNERKVAYSITKDEISKWQDTVQMIRQSEHVDYSKLNEAEGAKKVESSAFIQPSSNVRSVLESKIDKVLTDSNLNTMIKQDSEQLANVSPDNFEELPVAKMTKEELMKRNQEMRLMRELMFREERKAKRIKKIKSKSYRKIKRKELLKNQQLLDEENEDDEDMEDADVKRARERMTLKHKNTSKWARDMVKHGMTKDKETREELEEMLRQGDQLTNRIHGRDDSGKRKGVNSDDEPISLSDLEREQDNATNNGSLGKTGVLGMKFMTDAEQRKKEQNRKELEALRRFENGESDNEDIFEDQFGEGINKAKNQGRRVYTPTAMLSKQELEGAEADAEAVKEVVKEAPAKESKKTVVEKKKEEPKPVKNDTSNPWLDEDSDDEKHVKKSSKVHVIDKDSSKMAKASNKIKKHQDRVTLSDKASNNSGNEMILDIEKNTLNIIDPYAKGQNSGNDAFEEGFQNEDLISQAFAGDDVVSKFDQEKQRVIIDEDDKQVDMTLPGWGGWAGDGVKKTNQKKVMKTVKGIAKKDKRRDKNLKNVIINEKVNKKNLKYQASAVPFPYENKEQYEKSLQIPLGPEWSSSNTYSKAIKPRAIVKKSQVIDPLKKPFN